ncbi:MAG: SIR2 family protein [bacterium]
MDIAVQTDSARECQPAAAADSVARAVRIPGGNHEYGLRELEKHLDGGELIAFVGSGTSNGVYDSWSSLVGRIYKACVGRDAPDLGSANPQRLIELAEVAKQTSSAVYHRTIAEVFARQPQTRCVYQYLAKAGFRNYVTTNFDCLIADALAQLETDARSRSSVVFPYPGPLLPALQEKKTVVYIHGYVGPDSVPSEENPVVLASSEFALAYEDESPLKSFLTQLFVEYAVCFIGCRLQELPLRSVLSAATRIRRTRKQKFSRPLQPLFILLETWSASTQLAEEKNCPRRALSGTEQIEIATEQDETRYYQDMGLNVVRYAPVANHLGLDILAKKWAKIEDASVHSPSRGGLPYE